MADRQLPRYPIFIPTKGRADRCLTAHFLMKDQVPFQLVVEPQEVEAYAARFGEDRVLVLPFSNQGSVIPARNWIKDHSAAAGHMRHWQLDDNMRMVYRWFRGKLIPCRAGVAFRVTEDFVDRYTNVAIAGLNYEMFATQGKVPPFYLNVHVYSCSLILNSLPHRWRGRFNEDTDLCLQVLSDHWCTILMNAFVADKVPTMTIKGGNTDEIYQDDGRAHMARSLERMWPGVVTTRRRYHRPQHVVRDAWAGFDTPLLRRTDLEIDPTPNEYGMQLEQVKPIRSTELQQLLAEYQEQGPGKP